MPVLAACPDCFRAATAGPGYMSGGVGVKDACQLARGVPLCPDECEVRAARPVTAPQRDRRTTPHCLTLIPARRVPARGVVGPNRIKVVLADGHHGDGHKRPDGQCVLCAVPEALLHANPAGGSATCHSRRGRVVPGESRQREAKSLTPWRWSVTECWPAACPPSRSRVQQAAKPSVRVSDILADGHHQRCRPVLQT